MKKTLIILSIILTAFSARADWKEDLKNVFRNQARPNVEARQRTPFKLTKQQHDSIVNSITDLHKAGLISTDSVISLALYHKSGSPEITERCLRAVVSDNDLRSVTELGALYALTPQFTRQSATGLRLLQSAANAGYDDANAYLGLYYYNRNDMKKAKAYLEKCNPMNFGFGYTALGGIYLEGKGVRKDVPKAREYFHQGALKGYVRGTSLYGHNLRASGGGPINYPEAFFWLYIAADLGDDTARSSLYLPLTGESLGEGESAQDARVALDWISTVHSMQDIKNDPIYKEGFLKGLKEKEAAAEKGDDWARFYLGGMNYNGDFLEQNYVQAARYYEPIARNGRLPRTELALVNHRLAKMYKDGKGVKADPIKAARYEKTSANYGNLEAYKTVEHFK